MTFFRLKDFNTRLEDWKTGSLEVFTMELISLELSTLELRILELTLYITGSEDFTINDKA
jgi:hypothetical protein